MKIWISLFAVLCFAGFARAQAPDEMVPFDNSVYKDLYQVVQYDLAPHPYAGRLKVYEMTRYEFAIRVAVVLDTFYRSGKGLPIEDEFYTEKSFLEVFEHHPEVAASFLRLLKEFTSILSSLGLEKQIQFAQGELAMHAGSTPSPKPPIAAPFRDVPKTHWAFEAVEKLRQSGIVIGTPDGAFGK